MQAAGRMRQLEKGNQIISLVGTLEVERQIREVNVDIGKTGAFTAVHVIQWAMHNTIQSVVEGKFAVRKGAERASSRYG